MAETDSNHVIISRKEAKAKGLTHYFTGKPCLRGHIARRHVTYTRCLECANESFKQWRVDNPEIAKAIDAKSYAKNKHRENEKSKEYYYKNRVKMKEKNKKWHRLNRGRHLALNVEWRRKNPLSIGVHNRNRKARKRRNGGTHTAADIVALKKLQKGKCAFFAHCGQPLMKGRKKNYQVDHIIPLSKGGSNGRENLQLLCPSCNLSKHDHDPLVHARSLGLIL